MSTTEQAPRSLDELIAFWDSGEGRPFKRQLIDEDWDGDGEPPLSCMCAQGQGLYLFGGWTLEQLRNADQTEADRDSAKLYGISVTHAVLLRHINDSVEGAPSVVLTAPEKVLGDQAQTVLAFWRHLDRMTPEDWKRAAEARGVARTAAWAAARDWAAAEAAAFAAASAAAPVAAAWAAGVASNEIQGARIMRERGQPFVFLPLFGFADPEAVLAAEGR